MYGHRTASALTLLLCLGVVAAGTPAVAASPADSPTVPAVGPAPADPVVAALDRAAHPLRTVEAGGDTRDLRPLDHMIGDARVVGLGEATHGSHDFFALKHRVFRRLVEEKGFRTFALEAPWSTGVLLDDYVVHGKGDPKRIMRDEFQNTYLWWNNTDYLRLVRWMRAYNIRHPDDPVRFLGNDIAWTGPEVYDAVGDHVAATRPELSARLAELYRGLRPTVATGTYIEQYMSKPYAEREEMAARTGEALELVRRLPPDGDRDAHDMAVRQATAIDRTARQYAFDEKDPAQVTAAMLYRSQAMATNTLEWRERTGTKVLVSAHNNHVGYRAEQPQWYPKVMGAFLRDALGKGYVSVGLSFDHGSFMATDQDETAIYRWTLGPAGPGSNEWTLDRARPRDYVLDLRSVGSPAHEWLCQARTTRGIGTSYPDGPYDIALAEHYDVLVHLHDVEAARLRGRETAGDAPQR
ncbi:erythromycin esterase family protein [Streptomyces sp. NPDC012510]|uniref:erythromycin esterase family protein n=1 Tax=Streptomyces sp. NPDC012510 TaxID=3364838 RepID=UPI0036EE7474